MPCTGVQVCLTTPPGLTFKFSGQVFVSMIAKNSLKHQMRYRKTGTLHANFMLSKLTAKMAEIGDEPAH